MLVKYCTIFGYSYGFHHCTMDSWYVGWAGLLLLASFIAFSYIKVVWSALRLMSFLSSYFFSTMTTMGTLTLMSSGLLRWSSQLASLSLDNRFIDYFFGWFSCSPLWINMLIWACWVYFVLYLPSTRLLKYLSIN